MTNTTSEVLPHEHDAHAGAMCTDDGTGSCSGCGVAMVDCEECGGIGYHTELCGVAGDTVAARDVDNVLAVTLAEDLAKESRISRFGEMVKVQTKDGWVTLMRHDDGMYTLSFDVPGASFTAHISEDDRRLIGDLMGALK